MQLNAPINRKETPPPVAKYTPLARSMETKAISKALNEIAQASEKTAREKAAEIVAPTKSPTIAEMQTE